MTKITTYALAITIALGLATATSSAHHAAATHEVTHAISAQTDAAPAPSKPATSDAPKAEAPKAEAPTNPAPAPKTPWWSIGAVVLLAISEVLALVTKPKSSGVLALIGNLLKSIAEALRGRGT